MSSNKSTQPRHAIFEILCNMGFTRHYVNRSLNLYEKHYNIIKVGYHIEIITEIIFRLTIKDKLKHSQTIYCSKVNVKEALESMSFSSHHIDIAIEDYHNLWGKSSYDIQIITKTIMNSRATEYRKKQQQQLLKMKMDKDEKVHEQVSNSIISFDTNDTGDTPTDNNHNYNINNYNNYRGYLWKQSSKQRNKWQKRWFILHDGEFQYFKDSDKASNYFQCQKYKNRERKNRKEYIGNIESCKVNKIVIDKHKYVISVTTPLQRTYLLKTFSITDYDKWFNVLSPQKKQCLLPDNDDNDNDNDTHQGDEKCEYKQRQRLLFKIQNGNRLCADCNAISPEWISINIGVLICFDCAAIHRDLGCSVTKVRSLMLDHLDINTLKCIVNIGGNQRLNDELLEYNLCKSHKIDYKTCSVKHRSEFIRFKYVKKVYINTNNLTSRDFNQYLFDCAVKNDCFGIIFALCNGTDVNHSFREKNDITALQASILQNNDEAERLLVANDASPMVQI